MLLNDIYIKFYSILIKEKDKIEFEYFDCNSLVNFFKSNDKPLTGVLQQFEQPINNVN